jgi:phosphoserine phosphatase
MTHVATLICNPAFPIVTQETIRRAMGSLTRPSEARWLSPGVAADISFEPRADFDAAAAAEGIRALFEGAAVDVIVQRQEGRRKKLLLADMDSTMIGQECIDELAAETGKKAEISAITGRAMRGEIAFEPALRERVALLKGLDRAVISKVLANRVTLTPGACVLVRTMRASGAYTALISGGFSTFASAVAQMLGFDEYQANELLFDGNGRVTGVAEPVLGAGAKRAALLRLSAEHGLSSSETLAVGDGANDLSMLSVAGLGVAYHAKPKVAAAAQARIDYSDLTALLYAQGYERNEFAACPSPSAVRAGAS